MLNGKSTVRAYCLLLPLNCYQVFGVCVFWGERRVNGLHLEGVRYSQLTARPLEIGVTVLDHHNTSVSETRLRATASLTGQIYLTVSVTFFKIVPG